MDASDGENLLVAADGDIEEVMNIEEVINIEEVLDISDIEAIEDDNGEGSDEETEAVEDGSVSGLKRKIKVKASIWCTGAVKVKENNVVMAPACFSNA